MPRRGTLQTRLSGAPTGGNLRGKTRQIEHVRAMARWVTARDGVPLVYVAIFNHTPHPFQLTAPLDIFGIAVLLFPG
jgi:D-alanyl-D-alanine carboxypeptidase